ncbi:hypothetical protein ACHAXT_000930 [Thalassiosira profunda]
MEPLGRRASRRRCRTRQIAALILAAAHRPTVTMAQATGTQPPTQADAPGVPAAPTVPTMSPIPGTTTTLAPFRPLTTAPAITAAPVTDVPDTPPPTSEEPTLSPIQMLPTVSPTEVPSVAPTVSSRPTASPSYSPTSYPTRSAQPTGTPSQSGMPSWPPSAIPTLSPVYAPSGSPSTNETSYVKRVCSQILEVETLEEFTDVQVGIYQLLMQSYTVEFGYFVAEPQIVTTCEVIGQDLAGRRRGLQTLIPRGLWRRLQTPKLVMEFTMEYKSRYGFDVENYPQQFGAFINANLERVTADMESRFLPVVEAQDVIVFNTKEPTSSPTFGGDGSPTASPSYPSDARPTRFPTLTPTFTAMPSSSPTYAPTPNGEIVEDRTSFIVGLAAGLGGAAVVMLLLIWYMRKKNREKEEENAARFQGVGEKRGSADQMEEGFEVSAEDAVPVAFSSDQIAQPDDYPRDADGATSPQGMETIADSLFSNPSMVSSGGGGGSLSSNPEDNVPLEGLQDEFDVYKNQDLEILRDGVEEAVNGSEGMMSLAMTRALMEDEDAEVNTSWGGAEDPESIEANALCETNDWLRKNEHSTLEERNLFFQEILNRMVTTVRRGLISPSEGTRAIHSCAAMLGLQLEKDLPNNVLLVHGMRKTSDLSLGRSYLVDAFNPFGDIEGAAIAPSNRGFGFVRFVSPKSVQRAMERFRISEIEVQDVSVMIKSLKADAPVA